MTRPRARGWLVTLRPQDWLTLMSAGLAVLALLAALESQITLAVSLLLAGLLTDMADGALARAADQTSAFGRLLDSLVDVPLYLILPMVVLYESGYGRPAGSLPAVVFVVAGMAVIGAGVLRLAYFSEHGFVSTVAGDAYPGLPVFWTHLILALGVAGRFVAGPGATGALVAALLATAVLMVRDRPFWKPPASPATAGVVISVALAFGAAHALGFQAP